MKSLVIASLCTSLFGATAPGNDAPQQDPNQVSANIQSILEEKGFSNIQTNGIDVEKLLQELNINMNTKGNPPESDEKAPEQQGVQEQPGKAEQAEKPEAAPAEEQQPTVKAPEKNDESQSSDDKQSSEDNGLQAQEQQMLDLVNNARAEQGLEPLQADPELTKLARLKAQDMIDNSYFSHQSPTYGSPFDMMNQFGVEYQTAGENLAGNQTVEKAHEALMNSQGHRENILKSDYTNVGIGVVEGGPYGTMYVQLFKG
ncbi:CAP domain-containing protein [Aureibacillus halotolerans]|uniref:Putative YkwD family protein n=1 Tax=Aureibacillus halotolerans TaxID=1508390 RepID=A0A4R6U6J8_9BACI|nr:CAP domain-containing protein [Aureibacillus halotolerans]TDQ40319.1 putative YkwD family protein [Aureibacillus halotolerans]